MEVPPHPGQTLIANGKPGRKPGFVGSSNREIRYICDSCGGEFPDKKYLLAKRVTFLTIGKPVRIDRTRTTAWVCLVCLETDTDYNREVFIDAPGSRDIRNAAAAKED